MANNTVSIRFSKNQRSFGYVGLLAMVPMLLCLASCTATITLPATPEPICEAHEMPTAEKYIPPTLEAPPPTRVHPGQLVTVRFSGGYLFLNYGIGCFDGDGKADYVGYAHRDELAWSEHTRTTRIKLSQSDERCEIEFVVPPEEPYYAIVCGRVDVVGYVRQDELPRSAHHRAIEVYLDEDLLTSTECENECRVEFAIPSDTAPGRHKLKIGPGFIPMEGGTRFIPASSAGVRGLEFDIQVVERGTTTP